MALLQQAASVHAFHSSAGSWIQVHVAEHSDVQVAEQTPLTGLRIAQLATEAGFPPGRQDCLLMLQPL